MSFKHFVLILATLFVLLPVAPAWSGPGGGTPVVASADFNGDGETDVLFRDASTGEVAIWTTASGAFASASSFLLSPAFEINVVGKFSNDSVDDIVLSDPTTGATGILIVSNLGIGSFETVGIFGANNTPVATADFNSDGNLDLVFMDSTGNVSIALLSSTYTFIGGGFVGLIGSSDRVIAAGNFDNDSNPDLVLQIGTDIGFWKLGGANNITIQSGSGFGIPAGYTLLGDGADVDDNGINDLVVRQTSSGNLVIWFISTTGMTIAGNQFVGSNSNFEPLSFAEFTGSSDTNVDLLLYDSVNMSAASWQLSTGLFSSGSLIGSHGAAYTISNKGQ